jgi:hypothetical protein
MVTPTLPSQETVLQLDWVAAGFSLREKIPSAHRSHKGCGYLNLFPFAYYDTDFKEEGASANALL